MLDETDADRVKRWLAAQFERAAAKGELHGIKAKLADYCGASPQAVSGWLKTGRIKKSHLAKAEQFFGAKADFIGPADNHVRERDDDGYRVTPVRWPFPSVSLDALLALPPQDLLRLEGALLLAAAQLGLDVKLAAAA